MKAKLLIFFLLCCMTGTSQARRIEQPSIREVRQHHFQISAVELTDTATIIEMEVRERKNSWYMVDTDIVLRDPQGVTYPIQRYESPYSSKFGRRLRPKKSGTGWLRMFFPPLPPNTEWIDYTGVKETIFAIKGIRLDGKEWYDIWLAENNRRWDALYASTEGKRMTPDAKSVKGKWQCAKDFIQAIDMKYYFPHLKGTYKFKDDGTFTARFEGIKRYAYRGETMYGAKLINWGENVSKLAYIKVKGTYQIVDGKMTTKVRPKDVKCFFDQGRDHPDIEESDLQNVAPRYYDMKVSWYEQREKTYERMGNTIRREWMHLWVWNQEPVTVTPNQLLIGQRAIFER